jgi:hypothetical protein
MDIELSELAKVVLFKISKSNFGTDQTGKFMTVDMLEQAFGDAELPNITQAIEELKVAKFVKEIEESDDAYFLTPYGEAYLQQPRRSSLPTSAKLEYVLNALEEGILQFFYGKGRNGRVRKETPTGLMQDFARTHTDIERDDIAEAIDILVYQKYLSKKTESHRFDPKVWNKYSNEKARTIKTEYVDLTGKALLHIKNRTVSKSSAAVFDSSTPYATRRQLETIFEEAKKLIYIGDNYIGRKTLDYLQMAKVPVRIITSSNTERNFDAALEDFRAQYPSTIDIKVVEGVLHGRFIIADDRYYALDHSIKDFGSKQSTLMEMIDAPVQAAYKKLFDDNW